MKFHPVMAVVLLLSGSAWAEHLLAKPEPAITDPAAFVPPVRYRSVFADTPTGVAQDSLDWKKANAEVGQFRRGFVDILQWEAAHKPDAAASSTPAAAPAHKH